VFVKFKSQISAALAILALDGQLIDKQKLRVSFGTTRFCKYFLNKENCVNNKCPFVHYFNHPNYYFPSNNIKKLPKIKKIQIIQSLMHLQKIYNVSILDLMIENSYSIFINQGDL